MTPRAYSALCSRWEQYRMDGDARAALVSLTFMRAFGGDKAAHLKLEDFMLHRPPGKATSGPRRMTAQEIFSKICGIQAALKPNT
jgi:hypothetical protein